VCEGCGVEGAITLKNLKEKLQKGPLRCKKCAIKYLWQDPEYKEKIRTTQDKVWSDASVKQKISETSKALWQKDDYRKSQLTSHNSSEYVHGTRLKSASLWKDPEFRRRQLDIRSREEWKLRQSARMKLLWSDPKYRGKTLESLASVFTKGFRSTLEITTSSILSSLGCDYIEQKVVGPWIFDFYIPANNLFIECQGEYWHSLPRAVSRDLAKRTYLKKAFADSKILYLNEIDFANPEIVKDKLVDYLNSSESIDIKRFNLKDVNVEVLNSSESAKSFLNSFHYGGFGRSPRVIFGAYLGEELIAVSKFAPPVRLEVATSLGLDPKNVLELDRFCIHPNRHQKNFASWFISKSIKLISAHHKSVTSLVSFADMTHDHEGTIYKASNWDLVGTISPDYYYVNEDGWILHKKTLYNQAVRNKMKETDYAVKHGYKKVLGKEKHKFVYRVR
jgi:hypothetical protein